MKLEVSRQFSKNILIWNVAKNSFYGSQVVARGRAEGQTGGQTDIMKSTVTFRNFAKAPKWDKYWKHEREEIKKKTELKYEIKAGREVKWSDTYIAKETVRLSVFWTALQVEIQIYPAI